MSDQKPEKQPESATPHTCGPYPRTGGPTSEPEPLPSRALQEEKPAERHRCHRRVTMLLSRAKAAEERTAELMAEVEKLKSELEVWRLAGGVKLWQFQGSVTDRGLALRYMQERAEAAEAEVERLRAATTLLHKASGAKLDFAAIQAQAGEDAAKPLRAAIEVWQREAQSAGERAEKAERERDAKAALIRSYEQHHVDALAGVLADLHIMRAERTEVEEQRDAAQSLLREVATSGAEDTDPRITWVDVQIPKPTWAALQALLAPAGKGEQEP